MHFDVLLMNSDVFLMHFDVFLMYSETVFGCILNAFCCISAWDWILGTIFCRYMYVVPALFGCLGTGLGSNFSR